MAAMDFRKLAKECIKSEEEHAIEKKDGEPAVRIGIEGNHLNDNPGNVVHVLTAMGGKKLTGTAVDYVEKHDVTVLMIKCSDIRDFYGQMDWTPEEFTEDKPATLH